MQATKPQHQLEIAQISSLLVWQSWVALLKISLEVRWFWTFVSVHCAASCKKQILDCHDHCQAS